jgi:hypothetical protein
MLGNVLVIYLLEGTARGRYDTYLDILHVIIDENM